MKTMLIRKRKSDGLWHIYIVSYIGAFIDVRDIAAMTDFSDVLMFLNAPSKVMRSSLYGLI